MAVALAAQAGAQTCTPVRPGLVSWWDSRALSGTTAADRRGANPGTVVGGVTVVRKPTVPGPREFETALAFDGTGFISMGNAPAFQFGTNPFSLEAWFAADRGGQSIRHIFSKSNYPVSNPGAGYWIRLTPNAEAIEFFIGETVGVPDFPRTRITVPVSPGVWHQVVGTRDATGNMELYLDGKLRGQDKIDPTFSVDAPTPFTLGAWNERFGPSHYFSGLMNDISVYARALTSNEVNALFTSPKCEFR